MGLTSVIFLMTMMICQVVGDNYGGGGGVPEEEK